MKTRTDSRTIVGAMSIICLSVATPLAAQSAGYERPPIDYLNAEVHDPVAKLAAKLDAGEIDLDHDDRFGYLPAMLAALDIPVSSQTLVFSKTSLQLHRISPRRPRAIYFNDDVYVGYCQNGDVLELAATDPRQGATFYTVKQSAKRPPKVTRDRGQCLSCHGVRSQTDDASRSSWRRDGLAPHEGSVALFSRPRLAYPADFMDRSQSLAWRRFRWEFVAWTVRSNPLSKGLRKWSAGFPGS